MLSFSSRGPTAVNHPYQCENTKHLFLCNKLLVELIMISSFIKESILKSVFIKVIVRAINNVDSIRADISFHIHNKNEYLKRFFFVNEFLSQDKMSDSDFLQLY